MTNSNSTTARKVPAQLPTEFHLIALDHCAEQEPESASLAPLPLVIPSGVSRLTMENGAQVSLRPDTASSFVSGLRLEPLFSRPSEPRLLLAIPARHSASVNGVPAPHLALLTEGDRFQFDTGPAFRVALHHRPRLEAVLAAMAGVVCPVCTLALADGDLCFVCPCGTPFHAEDESREGALCCVRMITHCPHCQQAVRLVAGYGELSQPDHD